VCAPSDVLKSEQLRYRGFFATEWNDIARRTVTLPGAPYQLQGTPWRIRRPAPRIDEHREEILRELEEMPS
jgi:benzylsuccinate CoA-transferase BbsE subunit